MFDGHVVIEDLPMGGPDSAERRLFSAKGEMAQILNREHEPFRHLVYWDLDSARTGQERGHHVHAKKIEHFYVIQGELEMLVEDPATRAQRAYGVKAGNRITIHPGLAHASRSLTYAQVLEYASGPYDPSDTRPYKLTKRS